MDAKQEVLVVYSLRELDALVAERVMGWATVYDIPKGGTFGKAGYPSNNSQPMTLPFYSADMGSAWEVVTAIRKKGYQCSTKSWTSVEEHQCCFSKIGTATICACQNSMPVAICLAALQTCGVEADLALI